MYKFYSVIAHMSDMSFPEQEAKCNEYCIDLNLWAREVQVHFFESDFHNDRELWMTPHEAIDALAIKGNVDFVRFHNGNLGFVATYGELLNGFEIIPERKLDYRLVNKYGRKCVEIRYKGTEWSGWYFLISEEPKANWLYIPELNVWRCNVSAF